MNPLTSCRVYGRKTSRVKQAEIERKKTNPNTI